jgi:MoaA/NifB/PqqE/SkfB family radical SAM enzyme
MGFPKPWPTGWPIELPTPNEKDPEDPVKQSPEDDEKPLTRVPEYRSTFRSVTWAVNHACNLRCTHCYDVVPFRRHDLNTEQALAVIDRLSEAGVTFIAFSGGEAFLRKDLFQLMEHSRRRSIQIGARSNGTRITVEAAHRLRALETAVVGVSFDGATPETHDSVRGAGAFAEALAGIRALISVGIRAQMEVVLSRQNAHEALDFIRLGEEVGVTEVNFSAMTPQGRGSERVSDLLDHDLWLHLAQLLREASRNARVVVSPNCALLGPCCANIEPHITCDGWMTPCYLSTVKLLHVLQTPAEEIRERLSRDRPTYLDVCGRKAWTHRTNTASVPQRLISVAEILPAVR